MHTTPILPLFITLATSASLESIFGTPLPDFCDADPSTSQNPINIPFDGSDMTVDPAIQSTLDCDFPKELTGIPVFTGETVRFDVETVSRCTFGEASYALDQFHFHWGEHDGEGSEHSLDGEFYPLEMHMVHVNEAYADASEALQFDDGFLVLSVLFKVDNDGANNAIAKVIGGVSNTVEEGPIMTLKTKQLLKANDASLHKGVKDFCTVHGSLTTAPCTPNVRWVFSQHIGTVSKKTMKKFRALVLEEHAEGQAAAEHVEGEQAEVTEEEGGDSDEEKETDDDEEEEEDDDEEEDNHSHPSGHGHNFRPIQSLGSRTIICSNSWDL